MKTRGHIIVIAFAFVALLLLAPTGAYAAVSIDTCAPGQPWEYTSRVVECIERSVRQAVTTMLSALSNYMQPVVGAMATLAVAIFGIRMLGGEPGMRGKMPGFALRLGFVTYFAFNLGGISSDIFSAFDSLMTLVSGGSSPWVTLDETVGRIVGKGPDPNIDIDKGLLAIMGAALVSSAPGGFMGFIAISALINLLLFVFRVVFTYLVAYTAIAFLIAISPLVIPMAMFAQHGARFFYKWVDILVSAMLVPILLFAFLNFFLTGFAMLIDNIFRVLCDNPNNPGQSCLTDQANANFMPYIKINAPSSAPILATTDPGYANELNAVTGAQGPGKPAVQTNIFSNLRRAHDISNLNSIGVDFGPSNFQIIQELIYAFASLWLFASFMKSLVDQVPDIAYNISEASLNISMAPSGIEKSAGGVMRTAQSIITGRR